ncbi:MAG: ABC transporter permease [Candidatus Nomurabacteria bacterium]|nr:ABC transporter permease [Candidatus Nomurabacteria bacterium]
MKKQFFLAIFAPILTTAFLIFGLTIFHQNQKTLLDQQTHLPNDTFLVKSQTQTSTITTKDLDQIENSFPLANYFYNDYQIIATNDNFFTQNQLETNDENPLENMGLVLGYNLAMQLFSSTDIIGRPLKINSQTFFISEVLPKSSESFALENLSNLALINYRQASAAFGYLKIDQFFVQTNDPKNLSQTLKSNHFDQQDFTISDTKTLHDADLTTLQSQQNNFLILATAIIFLSLFPIFFYFINFTKSMHHEISLRQFFGAKATNIFAIFLRQIIKIILTIFIISLLLGFAAAKIYILFD